MQTVEDQLPWLEKTELMCLLSFTYNYVVSVEEVSPSSWCLGWAALFYCDSPCTFNIINFVRGHINYIVMLRRF